MSLKRPPRTSRFAATGDTTYTASRHKATRVSFVRGFARRMTRTKEERRKAGLFPTRDMDVETCLELLAWSWYRFARSTATLPPALIRQVLDALTPLMTSADPGPTATPMQRRDSGRTRTAAIFLHAAVDPTDDARLSTTWRDGVNALKVFESQYAWGSKEKAARLKEVRQKPRLVEACRAASVGAHRVPLELLAVLAMEGSEAAVDALMPQVERALREQEPLDGLSHLARYAAPTKEMKALVALLTAAQASTHRDSPALALARRLGIDGGERFRVEVNMSATPRGRLTLTVDSKGPGAGFSGWVSKDVTRPTSFVTGPGECVCALEELPTWLADWARANGVTWDFDGASTRHLRGARLVVFLGWLFRR